MINNIGNLAITDFSLHSIGVILFRYHKIDVFHKFIEDIATNTNNLSLPVELYNNIIEIGESLTLDFDDTYQYAVAKYFWLKLVTMDKDFEKVKGANVLFLEDII